jgi:tryptophanyl-tRNA synthetase
MRPTGRLHLGNYWGALKKWVELTQDNDCFYCVADWHMLTTGYEDTAKLQENVREMVLDWLAAGLDPKKCVIFKQSDVPEHAELALLLGMVTPLSWLETKHSEISAEPKGGAQVAVAKRAVGGAEESLRTFGFLGYPVLQAADILLYRGAKVPVGQDQLPHLELSREIARRFNSLYGGVFPEPQPVLTPTPKIPGTDGRKMSKSYGNTVDIFETAESLNKKVMSMYTDPTKIKRDDKGHPEPCAENPPGCVVFALHKLYGDKGFVARRDKECRAGEVGCVACKKDLLGELEPSYADFRKARERFASDPKHVEKILEEGGRKARLVAQKTMAEARRAVRLS